MTWIGANCGGHAFERRRRRRRLTINQIAEMLGIGQRTIRHYECDRMSGVSAGGKIKLDEINRQWTLEDYENESTGKKPMWPEYTNCFMVSNARRGGDSVALEVAITVTPGPPSVSVK